MADDTARAVQRAAHSPALRHAARAGLLGYALIHLLVAWLALQLGWGTPGLSSPAESTDSAGALALLAATPLGNVLLWVLAAALAGLCLWQAVEVLRHHSRLPPAGPGRRQALVQVVKTVGTAVLYGYLAVSAVRRALGDEQRPAEDRQVVRGVLSWPGGQPLVVAVAAVVAGIGVYHVQKGLRSGFAGEIDLSGVRPSLRTLTHRLAQTGFVLKGVALVLVGGVVGWAAATFDPERATGLDGALHAVAAEPYGRWLLLVVAVGLATFAVYLLARARHPVG
ncbi:DUF1206 domain-containing protein [Geodermatophilus saharensis]|uniref:DUF1206 domain-containing protein n=1 Tax=Geodermatophilus saharensis TaxID=1137994 RepID=UPI001595D5DD|nr:DUF1206 domain-containing protein [Geodermatophilus saharensis]